MSINEKKELFTSDTITERHNAIFVKAPQDKNFGYLFNIETRNENEKSTYTDRYDGKNLIYITPGDSTYSIRDIPEFVTQGTLLGSLKWIQDRVEKRLSKIAKVSDTTINGIENYHLIANVYDTIINKEHNYTFAHFYIDKLSGMPDCIIIKSRNTTYADGVSNYYSKTRYFDYKFNQDNIDIASMVVPNGFHPYKEEAKLPLLASGTVAPDWTLYDADGKGTSLAQMKGKIILLDFFFIGCGGCMEALKPLNRLHEKYKSQNVAMVSMTFRDNKKSVTGFKENYNIKYPIYIDAGDVVKLYHVEGFPTFYFIDQEGKIRSAFVGYYDDFEAKVTSIIDGLLKK
ncbi:MAG: TlpA family protein disulfide reductase [Bacteroidetes bacterium]|nr:TlpA family protein disulfide reductase [Bacteroidota bacterium]